MSGNTALSTPAIQESGHDRMEDEPSRRASAGMRPRRIRDRYAMSGDTALWPPAAHGFPAERLDEFLGWAADLGASDIAFQTGEPGRMEVDGALVTATATPLDSPALATLARRIAGETTETMLRGGRPVDCSYAIAGFARTIRRFRVNMSPVLVSGATGINISIRVLPGDPPTLDDLAIEPEIREAWHQTRGLTIVTGVPGSGKSTLLAAGTRSLLERGGGRIHSYEAPIEFVFDAIDAPDALMSSSEIPRHFATFAEALRASLRRRPTAVVVGEARDLETVEAVVRAADFGIAVYTTAHTIGVAATIRRLVAEFPATERAERGAALVDQLTLVVTQCLFPAPSGGRTALREWLVFAPRLKERLLETPQETWPATIAGEVDASGHDLASAGRRALDAGTIHSRDLARITAARAP